MDIDVNLIGVLFFGSLVNERVNFLIGILRAKVWGLNVQNTPC